MEQNITEINTMSNGMLELVFENKEIFKDVKKNFDKTFKGKKLAFINSSAKVAYYK